MLLSDLCLLGKGWSGLSLDGTYRLDWVIQRELEGQGRRRHSPDPVREVKKTREARKGQQKAQEEQAGLGDLGPCSWLFPISLVSNIPIV